MPTLKPPLFAVPSDPGTTRDAAVHPVGTHPRKSYLILHSNFAQKGVHVLSVPAASEGSGVARVALAQLVSMVQVVFECFGQRQWTPRVQP